MVCAKLSLNASDESINPSAFSSLNGNSWSYSETPQRTLRGAVIFSGLACGLAVLIFGSSFREKLPFILLFLVLVGLMVWLSMRITTVVISRKDAVIKKEEKSVFASRSQTYSLCHFELITVTSHLKTGEEGYVMANHSLVLQGVGQSLVILSTNDKAEAERLRDDLVSYLGFPAG